MFAIEQAQRREHFLKTRHPFEYNRVHRLRADLANVFRARHATQRYLGSLTNAELVARAEQGGPRHDREPRHHQDVQPWKGFRIHPLGFRRRALELLAASRDGCTETIMLAHGFSIDMMVELVNAVLAGGLKMEVAAGRRTLVAGIVGAQDGK
jgi:hypothetical protein